MAAAQFSKLERIKAIRDLASHKKSYWERLEELRNHVADLGMDAFTVEEWIEDHPEAHLKETKDFVEQLFPEVVVQSVFHEFFVPARFATLDAAVEYTVEKHKTGTFYFKRGEKVIATLALTDEEETDAED